MFSTKIRTTISAAGLAAVALAASANAASAALLMRSPATITPVVRSTATASKPKEVGSAGQPGYDNLKCEQMQSNAETAEQEAAAASKAGETKRAENSTAVANMMWNQIGSHCLVID